MNEKTIATIALQSEGYTDLEDILRDAACWVEAAAKSGADLAVLPETINLLRHQGSRTSLEHSALEDWRTEASRLCEAAAKQRISLVLPLLVREGSTLANRFYVLGRDGSDIGYYQKRVPAVGERIAGVEPGFTEVIEWEGLKIGGGICIDVYFPERVFTPQFESGADFFVIPSMTPAGILLDSSALNYGVPFVLAYSPWSRILDRDGKELAAGGFRSETLRAGFGSQMQLATINFDAVSLFADFNQSKMRDIQKHYGQKVRIRFDQANCNFFLESRSPELSIVEVMREFNLIPRRDYLAQLTADAEGTGSSQGDYLKGYTESS